MFYKKRLLLKKSKTYKITYNGFIRGMSTNLDDNLQNHKIPKVSYNFTTDDGSLKSGMGFKKLTFPTGYGEEIEMLPPKYEIMKCWHIKIYNNVQNTRHDRFIILARDGYLYWTLLESSDPNFYPFLETYQESIPNVIGYRLNGEDSIIVTSASNDMEVFTPPSNFRKVKNAQKFLDVCIHDERLFAITEGERTRLMFSANMDPTNWDLTLDKAGFIDMLDERGALNKLVSFKDYLYVIRDYGISRVASYVDQTKFTVSNLFNSSVKIYPDSVAVCGDKMLFLAKNGIYVFDGFNARKINLPIDNCFDKNNDSAVGTFYNGKYYLALRMNFDDEKVMGENLNNYFNNALIELDLSDFSYNIARGIDIYYMLTIKHQSCNKLVATFRGEYSTKIGELTFDNSFFDKTLPQKWVSPKSNLGFTNKVKIIKEINILSKKDVSITLSTDKETKTYKIKGKDTTQRIKTNVRGELVEISFSSQEKDIKISSPSLTIKVI